MWLVHIKQFTRIVMTIFSKQTALFKIGREINGYKCYSSNMFCAQNNFRTKLIYISF